jgi:hypothetical protein
MPWAMGILGAAYWLHAGTLPGEPASHGCIRQRPDDAERLFAVVPKGTTVFIIRTLRNLSPPSQQNARPSA